MRALWTRRGIVAGFLGGAVIVCAVSEAVPGTRDLRSGSGVPSTSTDATPGTLALAGVGLVGAGLSLRRRLFRK